MKLSTSMYAKGTRLEYGFNPKTGTHTLWIAGEGTGLESKVAGHVISALQPYRDTPGVKSLVSWLAGFNLDGGWCPR